MLHKGALLGSVPSLCVEKYKGQIPMQFMYNGTKRVNILLNRLNLLELEHLLNRPKTLSQINFSNFSF